MKYNAQQKHESTLRHTYVLNEFLTADRSCTTIFFNKLLQKLIAHILTLLLATFASKLINYSRHSEILNFRKNSKSTSFSFENSDLIVFKHVSNTHCDSKN